MSMETKHPPKPNSGAEEYEHSDANIRALVQFAFWLGVVLVAVILGMKWMFGYFARVQPLGPPASPFENARVLPPNPRLQVTPRADLENYRETELEELSTYGWVDLHNSVVRIPIDRAMDLVLQRGLPVRSAESTVTPGGSAGASQATQTTASRPPAEQDAAAGSSGSSQP
jgi:hypothetical protein